MNYMTKESIMARLQEHYEVAKRSDNEILGIFLQGSQNYIDDLFFEGSDVDSKAVYLPSVQDICLNKDISNGTLVLKNTEHIDRFDIRKFLELVKTPGLNTYELLFTEYYIINPKYQDLYNKILSIREDLVHSSEKGFLMATMGISKRDFNTLEKRTGGEDFDIETFGYSRKRLSNIMRFNATVKAYIAGKDFSACLKALDQETIQSVRRSQVYTLAEARELAGRLDTETKDLAQNFNKSMDKTSIKELEKIIVEIMVKSSKLGK